jgi:hypothetical protein
VARHELALGRRDLVHAGLNALVERLDLLQVGGGIGAVGVGVAGCSPAELVADDGDGRGDVAWVVPPVRVELRPRVLFALGFLLLVMLVLPRRDLVRRVVGRDRDLHGLGAGLLDHLLHPVVELVARFEDDLGAGHGLHVVGAGLVVVGIGVGL